jgi:hypothetical protein
MSRAGGSPEVTDGTEQEMTVGETALGPELTIDIEPMRDVLVGLLGTEAVRAMPDDLLGAMAYGIALVRQAPVEQRMEAMGLVVTGTIEHGMTGTEIGWQVATPEQVAFMEQFQ